MSKLRILFLDDGKDRHELFDLEFENRDVEIVHVWTYSGLVYAFTNQEKFELVSLDHDLGDYTGPVDSQGKSTELSGTEVADWMASSLPKEKWPERTIIHSWNSSGAERMRRTLDKAGFRRVTKEMFDPNDRMP